MKQKMFVNSLLMALVSWAAFACDSGVENAAPPKDVVLAPGQTVFISNANGSVSIEWDGETSRLFTYKGKEWKESMIARQEIWFGAWGIYSGGDNFFSRTKEVGRLVYWEARRDFDSESELEQYMNGEWNRDHIKYVWNADGLVGGLHFTPSRGRQLSVNLWKFTVRGQTPHLFLNNESKGEVTLYSPGGE